MPRLIDPSIPTLASLSNDDIFYVVNDPQGTPSDANVAASTIATFVANYINEDISNKHFDYFIPLTGVTDNQFNVAGSLEEVTTGESGDYTTDFSARGHHIAILVNSVTTGGDIIISGDSVTETDGVPTIGDSETITIDTTGSQYYQTDKKWLLGTNIDVSSGSIVGIDYDVFTLGYLDRLNIDFDVVGFRAEMRSTNDTADLAIVIEKIQDDGGKKMSIVTIEHIGIDSTNPNGAIGDSVRTGGNDRSYTFSENAWPDDTDFVLKYNDYDDYFSNDENVIEASTKNEGIIIRFLGEPSGGISGVDHCTLNVFYRSITS